MRYIVICFIRTICILYELLFYNHISSETPPCILILIVYFVYMYVQFK